MKVKHLTARTLISHLLSDSDQTRIAALCEIRLLSKSDPDIRPILAAEGAIPILVESLYSNISISRNNAVASILNLSISTRESIISTPKILDSLSHALALNSPSAAAIFSSLLIDESFRKTVGFRRDILTSLINIVSNPNSPIQSIKDALNALFGVALYSPNRGSLIGLGAVPSLFAVLGRLEAADEATAVMGLLSGCEEAADSFRSVSGVEVLVSLIDLESGASGKVRENAVSALLNLGMFCGDGMKEEIRRAWEEGRGFAALIDMVERGSVKEKSKAKALIRALDVESFWSKGSEIRVSNSMTTPSSSFCSPTSIHV